MPCFLAKVPARSRSRAATATTSASSSLRAGRTSAAGVILAAPSVPNLTLSTWLGEPDEDGLELGEGLDRAEAALAPQPRLLVAAEGRVGHDRVVVYADGAGPQRLRHAERPFDVGGEDAGAEAIRRVVGDADRFVLVGERDGRQHRPEDLLAGDLHLVVDVGEQRGVDEVPGGQVARGPVAAGDETRPLLLAALDVAHDLFELARVDDRPRGDLGIERVAECDHARQPL